MSFAGFLVKYADEAAAISKALVELLDGVAINPAQAETVKATIDKLEAAVESITETLATKPDSLTVKIAQDDIDAAVSRVLPAILASAVQEAVAAALAAKETPAEGGDNA